MDDDRRASVSDVTEIVIDEGGTDAADRVKVAVRVRPFTEQEVRTCLFNKQ